LAERGVLKNENTIVSSLVSKEQVQQAEMEEMMDRTFEGSMPAFIAAFANSKRLSKDDIQQLESLIEQYKE
jgi:predicted transcriptional regulator